MSGKKFSPQPSFLFLFFFPLCKVESRRERARRLDVLSVYFRYRNHKIYFYVGEKIFPPCLFSISFLHLWNKHVYNFFCIKNGYLSFIVKSEEFDMAGRRVNKNSKVGISFSRFLIKIMHRSYCCLSSEQAYIMYITTLRLFQNLLVPNHSLFCMFFSYPFVISFYFHFQFLCLLQFD